MKVGVPSEIKAQESRVGLTPQSVKELVKDNHTVLIQNNAGIGAGFSNMTMTKYAAGGPTRGHSSNLAGVAELQ